eukprot:m.100012 g.100012  ORF g.100012 m.100012 type:complete len:135 (-) comp15372_c0_seq1:9-413(-)
METLIELRHGIISPDFGKSAPNLGHHQTRHNHQPSRDMAKPLPDGVEFAGHATWPQNAGSQVRCLLVMDPIVHDEPGGAGNREHTHARLSNPIVSANTHRATSRTMVQHNPCDNTSHCVTTHHVSIPPASHHTV